MATNNEVSFPVESFTGVNRNLDREDRSPSDFENIQNMYEKTVGVMETRPGSEEAIKQIDFPLAASGNRVIKGIDNIHKFIKDDGEKVRMAAIHCDDPVTSDTLDPTLALTETGPGSLAAIVGGSFPAGTYDMVAAYRSIATGNIELLSLVTPITLALNDQIFGNAPTDALYTYDIYLEDTAGSGVYYLIKEDYAASAVFIQAAPVATTERTLPSIFGGVEVQWQPDSAGYWLEDAAYWGTTMDTDTVHEFVMVRFYGYGQDRMVRYTAASLPNHTTSTLSKFEVTISGQPFLDDGILGFEVYAWCNTSLNGTSSNGRWMWCGAKDFKSHPTSAVTTHDFLYAPLQADPATTKDCIMEAPRSFKAVAQLDGSGSLVAGKTYYIMVASQYLCTDANTAINVFNQRCIYRQTGVNVNSPASGTSPTTNSSGITAVTLPPGTDSILVNNVIEDAVGGALKNTRCAIVFIGESPQLMQPVELRNNVPADGSAMSWEILDYPIQKPGVCDFKSNDSIRNVVGVDYTNNRLHMTGHEFIDGDEVIYDTLEEPIEGLTKAATYFIVGSNADYIQLSLTSGGAAIVISTSVRAPAIGALKHFVTLAEPLAETTTFQFQWSDFSVYDMMLKIEDDNTFTPIFSSRVHLYANEENLYFSFADSTYLPFVASPGVYQPLGKQSKYNYVDFQNLLHIVNDFDNRLDIGLSGGNFPLLPRLDTNLFISDGYICARTLPDYQPGTTTIPVMPPPSKYIEKYQEAILVTGGRKGSSQYSGQLLDSSKKVFFSQTLTPFNFSTAGFAAPLLGFFGVGTGDPTNGISNFVNTTGDETSTQIVISKKSELWALTDLPVSEGANGYPNTFLVNLSKKAGGNHKTFVNTPVGTIVADYDNIYLLREQGEPTPIGDQISPIIQAGVMDQAVAVYHDQHYKISFYHPDYGSPDDPTKNNVEFWLDIRKMKALQGKSDWKGPMIGRNIDYCIVEDEEVIGNSYDQQRERYCVDARNIQIFKADGIPQETQDKVYDFNIEVESEIETKDFEVTQQDNNWAKRFVRSYLKLKTNRYSSPLVITEKTYIDGELFSTKDLEFKGLKDVDWKNQPERLQSFFPTGRPRGRTIRKVYTTKHRWGLSGLQENFIVERRRL